MTNIIEAIKDKIDLIIHTKRYCLVFPEGTKMRESVGVEYRPTKEGEKFIVRSATWIDGTIAGQMANGDIFKAFDDPLSCSPVARSRKN